MKFGEVIEQLKDGAVASRQSWNGADQFIFLVDGAEHGGQTFKPYIAINDVRGDISPWTPTAVDMLEEDWLIASQEEDPSLIARV